MDYCNISKNLSSVYGRSELEGQIAGDGFNDCGIGVIGENNKAGGVGVRGNGVNKGVYGQGSSVGIGIYGDSEIGGMAGYFDGTVHITGKLIKSSGS